MEESLTLAPFDVVVVPFPYSDTLAEKRRPAVVVSVPELEAEQGWVWLAMITSAPGPSKRGDALVSNLAAAGLERPCRVRGAKVAVLDSPRILRRLGALAAEDRQMLQSALRDCLAF